MAESSVTTPQSPPDGLTREQLLALYRWMRLTRTLEERLVALYRQTKVVGGLFRPLGPAALGIGAGVRDAHHRPE